jgi:ferritin-like metal-binding protein YciE
MNKREMDLKEFGYVIGKVRDAEHELNHALDIVEAYKLSNDQKQRVQKVLERVKKAIESLEKVLKCK